MWAVYTQLLLDMSRVLRLQPFDKSTRMNQSITARAMKVRVDSEAKVGSVLDFIRIKNGIASNHSAALLAIIQEKHPNLKIWKARLNNQGRSTPIASLDTLSKIIELCPKTKCSGKNRLSAKQLRVLLTRKAEHKKPFKTAAAAAPTRPTAKQQQTFGQLNSIVRFQKIVKIS